MKRLSQTLTWSVLEKLIDVFNSAVVSLLVIRFLGPAEYGLYAYVLQVAVIAATVAAYGLDDLLFSEFSREPSQPGLMRTAIMLRLSMGAVAGVAATVLLTATVPELSMPYLLMLFYPALTALNTPVHWLRATVQVQLITTVRVGCLGIGLCARLTGIAFEQGGEYFFAVLALETGVMVALFWVFARRAGMMVEAESTLDSVNRLARRSLPLFMAAICAVLYAQLAGVYAFNLLGAEANGHFGAAQRIMAVLYLLAASLVAALLPFVNGDRHPNLRFSTLLSVVVYFGCATSLAIWLTADFAVPIVFGESFDEVAWLLKVLSLGFPFVCLGVATTAWLIQERVEWLQFWRTLAGLICALIMVPFLGQSYGIDGLAAATALALAAPTVCLFVMGSAGHRLLVLQWNAIVTPIELLVRKLGRRTLR
jgi:polysaccharide transporter, PST family